jgi:hypothetical protein
MKQVTLALYVGASPQVVHDVIADPSAYRHFVPGLTTSTWSERPGVGHVHGWTIELPVSSFSGEDAYRFEPGPTGAIELAAVDPEDDARYRWEFRPAGAGTLLLMYGYTDVLHANAFVRAFVRRQPTIEHGLALSAQLMLAEPMRSEAERRARGGGAARPSGGGARFEALLRRGQVAIMRARPDGHLADVSLVDRVYATEGRVLETIGRPAEYARFIPGVDQSAEHARQGVEVTYSMEMSIPIVTWATRYVMRLEHHGAEGAGVEGDLRGAHFRWDLSAKGPAETEVVYRAQQPLGRSSVIVRKLLQVSPTLERGLNVAFALITLRATRGRAEGWATK